MEHPIKMDDNWGPILGNPVSMVMYFHSFFIVSVGMLKIHWSMVDLFPNMLWNGEHVGMSDGIPWDR